MEHGMIPSPRTQDAVEDVENNGLDGEAQLDIVPITWDANYDPDNWWGPGWEWDFPDGYWDDKDEDPADGTDARRADLENTFGGTGRRCCFSYRLTEGHFSGGEEDYYNPGANGELEDEWKSFAEDLISMNMEDSIIRPSPEHTHDWSRRYPADSPGGTDLPPDEAAEVYADAFARCVGVMNGHRSVGGSTVSGSDFTFLYSPAGDFGVTGNIVEDAYPTKSAFWPTGEDLPIVCRSFYDSVDSGGPSADEWDTMTDAEKESEANDLWENVQHPNIENYRVWAESINAPLGRVEWGPKAGEGEGRGDNPWFLELMLDYMETHDFVFETVWSLPHADGSTTSWFRDGSPEPELDESFNAWKDWVLGDASAPEPEPGARLTVRVDSDEVVPSAVYYNDNGTEREATAVYVNDNGTEREIWPDPYT